MVSGLWKPNRMIARIRRVVFLLLLAPLFCLPILSELRADKPSVLFINPGRTGEVFWDMVSSFMVAAAQNLDLNLQVVTAERDHLKMIELANEAAQSDNPPEYMILVNEKLAAGRMLEELPQSIKLILLNNTLSREQLGQFGKPRVRVPNWIGHIFPDHEKAGYDIAQSIILAENGVADGAVESPGLLAIGGNRATTASVLRVNGMERALRDYPKVILYQTIHSQWRRDKAESQMYGLVRRWPGTRLIWAANDPMALGAMDAAIARGRKPGKDIFIGGLNWSAEALERVQDGKMVASIGGHFMQGGWAMVLIHDYHMGRDFADLGVEFTAPMTVIDQSNVAQYLDVFRNQDWNRIDFKQFTRERPVNSDRYHFDLKTILNQFEG
jgi:ABC-type sugar transport system substrate-binding protein